MRPEIPANKQPEWFPIIRVATRARIAFADGTVYEDSTPQEEMRIDDPALRKGHPFEQ